MKMKSDSGKDLVLHRAPDLQVDEIEGLFPAQAQSAEHERKKQQRERDREPDEDDPIMLWRRAPGGSWGVPRPSVVDYVATAGVRGGATAIEGR
jgi:hypothetical protein